MALIKCPECDKEISDSAQNCVHCGYPLNKDATEAKPQAEANMAVIQKGKSPVKDRKIITINCNKITFFYIIFICIRCSCHFNTSFLLFLTLLL